MQLIDNQHGGGVEAEKTAVAAFRREV